MKVPVGTTTITVIASALVAVVIAYGVSWCRRCTEAEEDQEPTAQAADQEITRAAASPPHVDHATAVADVNWNENDDGGDQARRRRRRRQDVFKVLILGDGNFSFSLAIAQLLAGIHTVECGADAGADSLGKEINGDSAPTDRTLSLEQRFHVPETSIPAVRYLGCADAIAASKRIEIVTTSFDSHEEVVTKYPESRGILSSLDTYDSITVLHNINAWEIPSHFPGENFDVVAWNHPHLGVEDFRLHRFLMAHFLHSAASALTPDGQVTVSLVKGQETRWDLDAQAARVNMQPQTPELFTNNVYPGYVCKRNKNGQSFKNTATRRHVGFDMQSFTHTYRFQGQHNPTTTTNTSSALLSTTAEAVAATTTTTTTATATIGANFLTESGEASVNVDGGSTYNHDTHDDVLRIRTDKSTSKSDIVVANPDFYCNECDRQYASARAIQSHRRQIHELQMYGKEWKPNRPKTIPCHDCHRKFHDVESHWQHRIAKHGADGDIAPEGPLTHEDGRPIVEAKADYDFYACEVCGQAVPVGWPMEKHTETLKPMVGLNAVCNICQKTFTEYRALRQHFNFCKSLKSGEEQHPYHNQAQSS